MEKAIIKGEEMVKYTAGEFIRATRPDGLGHIYFNDEHIVAFEEVICDCCNKELIQPEDEPDKHVIHVWADRAWCRQCFERWVLKQED
ncbi:MAG: hypothetical protein PHR77_03260 [Kiritimatiellae bacterium]|nr:hypothetical protein [Kiritimatiellia bacterium]MDD5519576.1 hypothetical protein [Kiritimatiellia bacterium]